MEIKVILDGDEYISKTSLEDAKEIANQHYKGADTFTTFMMELEDGEFMLFSFMYHKLLK